MAVAWDALVQRCLGRSPPESNTIGFEHGIRWTTCVQGAPVPLGVTGAEMNERGKPGAVWPARWEAPNKNKGKHHANPPSTRARVPATPRRGRTARPSTDWDSETKNRAYEPDEPSNGKILNGPERARQKRNAATARRPPEQRVTEASAKTAKPADADKRRYYTRTKDRVSEQKKDNADGCIHGTR